MGITIASFILATPKYQISNGIITIVLIIVILTLSESFNNLSLGKILSLSRKVDDEKEKKTQLTNENKELKSELFKIVSNIQQSQVNNTFNAPPEAWSKLLGVIKADEDEEDIEEENDVDDSQSNQNLVDDTDSEATDRRMRKDIRFQKKVAEELTLKKYVESLPISDTRFVKRVEFTSAFHAVDPIMDRRTVFDGYIQSSETEVFVEVRQKNMLTIMYMDRLYIMLNKVNLYRQAKKVDAKLLLLLLLLLLVTSTDFDEKEERRNFVERLRESFRPAIESKLFEIKVIEISEQEVQEKKESPQQQLF
ncbi:hypothetical protein [Vibrio crassostreae]|uniref:hypothetical protein n=1 Tax=Vibrio crassostreae TaxID=246167 RepID=UPI00352EF1F0